MLVVLIIAILTCLTIILSVLFFPKIKLGKLTLDAYWIIGLIGALLMIIFKQVSFQEIGSLLIANNSINPLKILILFLAMTLLSVYLDEVGFFKYLAIEMTKVSSKNQLSLFTMLYILVAILTIFTSNDIVILTFTPFICYFCKHANINPFPYLVSEFAAANTWSMMLIIGNPTNIYLAISANLNFISYFKVMWLPTLIAGIIEFALLILIFHKPLKKPLTNCEEDYKITDKSGVTIGLIHLIICLIMLIISSYINLPMWLIATICAISLLICLIIKTLISRKHNHEITKTLKRLPYQLIPFVLSMFVIVISLQKNGVSEAVYNLLDHGSLVYSYGIFSFLLANLMNNIPMSVFLATTIGTSGSLMATFATIIGSNVGAFLTPIGALAGIMFTNLLSKEHLVFGFKKFIKYGCLIAIPTLFTALIILSLVL